MIRERFYSLFVATIVASVVKIIISSACREKVSRLFQLLIDTMVLISVFCVFVGTDLYSLIDFQKPQIPDYENIEESMYSSVIEKAEELLEERVIKTVEINFSISPYDCSAKIDRENMILENLVLYFEKSSFISGYDLKRFLKNEYDIDAEVIFK